MQASRTTGVEGFTVEPMKRKIDDDDDDYD